MVMFFNSASVRHKIRNIVMTVVNIFGVAAIIDLSFVEGVLSFTVLLVSHVTYMDRFGANKGPKV